MEPVKLKLGATDNKHAEESDPGLNWLYQHLIIEGRASALSHHIQQLTANCVPCLYTTSILSISPDEALAFQRARRYSQPFTSFDSDADVIAG